jgi:hypothetical protein
MGTSAMRSIRPKWPIRRIRESVGTVPANRLFPTDWPICPQIGQFDDFHETGDNCLGVLVYLN